MILPHERQARLTLEGPDAQDFLQRLSTADLRTLAPGQSTPACFLTAQGRFRSYFALSCESPGKYHLDYDPGRTGRWREQLIHFIEQYTFSERFSRIESPASNYIEPSADQEATRIRECIPRVEHEITEVTNPLEVGLSSAIASQKGCYPGQEVIEKIISLGSPAQRLCLIEWDHSLKQIPIGSTSWSPAAATLSLAILRKTQAQPGSAVQSVGPDGNILATGKVLRASP